MVFFNFPNFCLISCIGIFSFSFVVVVLLCLSLILLLSNDFTFGGFILAKVLTAFVPEGMLLKMSTSYSSMTFSSPLDPSAEDKAQETFARLYQEHVTTEEQTKNSNCKTIHKNGEQSASTEHFYESWKNKNAFHPLPSNINKTNNLVQGNASNQQSNGSMSDLTDKEPRVTCTSKSSPNIFQSLSKEQKSSPNIFQSVSKEQKTATLRRNQAPSPPTQALTSLLRTHFSRKMWAIST